MELALQHNHNLLAARTTIDQSKAEEITANLRPNPEIFGDWDYLPFLTWSSFNSTYLHDLTEADLGLSYLIERGKKRQHRLQAAKDLYEHGAIALNDLQVAQDTEDKAKVAVDTAAEHLRLLGNDPGRMNFMVDIFAPVSGVVTDQEVTTGSLVQAYSTPYPFTISDLSATWVVCDVYENDLANVRLGDTAEISLNAYPDRMFKGRVSNIGAILDPNLRTAKVRIEVQNPGIMRLGMFVRATFHGQTREMHTIVPASAILHMHDRDFVYIAAPDKRFRRVEVVSGDLLPDNMNLQEIKSGLQPGQQVVTNALVLDHALAQ